VLTPGPDPGPRLKVLGPLGAVAQDSIWLSQPEQCAHLRWSLFLSVRTVEWHLRKVFAELRISFRMQLQRALPDGGRDMA
jgi:hypothetical protein